MTAVSALYRPPFDVVEALGRGEQVRVPMKGRIVRERMGYDGLWKESYPSEWERWPEHLRRERLVAPIQPATPCPDCDGLGIIDDGVYCEQCHDTHSYHCPTCPDVDGAGGSGYVGGDLGLVTDCPDANCVDGIEWFGKYDYDGRRLEEFEHYLCAGSGVVVAHRTQVTELLPVVDADVVDQIDEPCIDVNPTDGTVWLWETGMEPRVVTVEPWAQHLTPGMFVATLVGLWPIDPPVVPTFACPGCDGTGSQFVRKAWDYATREPCDVSVCDGGRVPLSVTPGEAVALP